MLIAVSNGAAVSFYHFFFGERAPPGCFFPGLTPAIPGDAEENLRQRDFWARTAFFPVDRGL
jgi:hypothetical protein